MRKIWIIVVFFLLIVSEFSFANDYLLVFAGAGMRLPLDVIGKNFEKQYGIKVVYDYEGSGRLGNKILVGQKPDVFIPGAEKWAKLLQKKGYVRNYWPIAYHIPVIITPLSNTKINNLQDFLRKDVRLVIGDGKACAIGRISSLIFKRAGLDERKLNIVARGVTVKQLVHWIEGKNADASIVWHADAVQSGKVRIVTIPDKINYVDIIPICEMSKALHPMIAQKYINYLLFTGKSIFKKYGFRVVK